MIMAKKTFIPESLIFVAYSIFIYLLYQKFGITEINEAEKYIDATNALIKGDLSKMTNEYLFYSSYILFLSALYPLQGAKLVVLAQAFLNVIAAYYLKKTTQELTEKKQAGYLIQILFLFC